ncbi:2-C-methyl-D-erythritol 4-phosphate cytidylyltransferase [Staphylococcus agnetis]|uniref:2-C-methyl-D-erythritol 4-phosphate cytidylyltransferase n=1 Tax=Staphylococcus agnetis TaxID=985762 RepID=UPI0004E37692|nr:2-C-methyl-D-erythritol 4-phosphate cytidylyltransferase [Staphylococcus agnetis]KFE41595.1 2-C-methyl-D-erythritol 4-phosphate cytidylyltransferase [Staphylococcus agnetis]NJH65219.1 2-C-methyl-D-erythritol 4-phosphate cytidylyltransferase [Staphylococcus agnetis]PTH49436.1 2-C-methyl-D-erythritol 4-phosphate cytidylyltransferase [Staphylococcus agnetis]PTH73170.1 2-C-methyl-D-erythritol 4-phosphate cytidylyltransferase [Staphylococcus agnetis]PTH74765.1 2-C-methyl-D-erythritol 4-phosphate
MQSYHVIIPAAGKGTRMKREFNKLFIKLETMTILEHTLTAFQSDAVCKGIYLAIHPRDRERMTAICAQFDKIKAIVDGGDTRQESIYNVLKQCHIDAQDVVFVHDGARPFISHHIIRQLSEGVREYGAAIVGVKAKDTIKVAERGKVVQTLNRALLWQVQTPQGATYDRLMKAYDKADQEHFEGTDDASLLENAGQTVHIVEGEYDNIKITTEEDLWVGRAFLEKRRNQHV